MKTLRLKRANREGSGKPEEGVTILEFALVAMIFMIFVVALFDFVRFLIVQSILKSSANRALSQAQVIANLDQDCLGLTPPADATCLQNRNAAFRTILTTIEAMPLNTMVAQTAAQGMHYLVAGDIAQPAVELNLSRQNDYRAVFVDGLATTSMQKSGNLNILDNLAAAATRPTLRAVLQQEPIQVTINARFRPVLPLLPEFPIQGTAAGYREIRGASSYPARVNCRGAEVPIGQAPDNSDCPCSAAPGNPLIHVINGGNCICVSNQMNPVTNPNGDVINCACPTPRVADGLNCVCPAQTCPQGGYVDTATCSCRCPGNQQVINGSCGCAAPLTNQNGNCGCASNPECQNSGGIVTAACTCQCPNNKPFNPATGRCECDTEEDECEHGQLDNQCNCQCTNGYSMSNGECRCLSPHVVQNGQCTCSSNIACQGGWIDQNSCACNCPFPKTLVNGVCSCGTVPCQGGTVDPNSCACNCSNGYNLVNGVCSCTAPHQVQNGQCTCPSIPCGGGGWIDQNSCACNCPYPKTLQNGTCKCPTVSCNGGTVDPNSCGCTCADGFSLVNGSCVCQSPRVVENGICRCSSSISCNNGTIDQNSCQCTCTSPRVYQAGACVCDPNLCQGGTQSPSSCSCTCSGGQVLVGNQCQCTGGTVFQNGTCSCTGGQIIQNGQCHCPQNQELINGQCQCPEGTTMLEDGSCFRPE